MSRNASRQRNASRSAAGAWLRRRPRWRRGQLRVAILRGFCVLVLVGLLAATGLRAPVLDPEPLSVRCRTTIGTGDELSIVAYTHNLNPEGASLALVRILQTFCRFHDCRGRVISPSDGPLRHMWSEIGFKTVIVPHVNTEGMSDEDADIFVVNTIVLYGVVNRLVESTPERVLWMIHEPNPYVYLRKWPKLARELPRLLAEVHTTLFVSDVTRDRYSHVGRGHFVVAPNWVDIPTPSVMNEKRASARLELGITFDTIVVLAVGTICERKAQLVVVQGFEQFLIENTSARALLLIVGGDLASPSVYEQRVRDTAEHSSILTNATVRFVDKTLFVDKYYAAADIHVSMSREESNPLNILEAMAFEKPIISSALDEVKEIVRGDVDGLYVGVGQPGEFAQTLARMASDASLRDRLGAGARDTIVHRFSETAVAPRFCSAILDVAGPPRSWRSRAALHRGKL